MNNVYIIHGSYGTPDENWFPWLKSELEKLNCKVFVPKFPTPENQSLDTWMKIFEEYKDELNEDAIIVGHSLGPAFILSILEKLEETKSGKAHFNEVVKLTKERKKFLVSTIQEDPTEAYNLIFSEKDRTEIASPESECVVNETTVEGTLRVIAVDFFDDKLSRTHYTLVTSNKKELAIYPAKEIKQNLVSGLKIKIKGFRIDDNIIFDASSQSSITILSQDSSNQIVKKAHAAGSGTTGDKRTAVILANFANTVQPSLTISQAQNKIFVETDDYYRENSYGKTSLSGDVFGWYKLNINQNCDPISTYDSAVAAANPDIHFPNFNRIIIVAPFGPDCGWGGVAIIGEREYNTPDGPATQAVSWLLPGLRAASHELGHNIGLHHANFWNCGFEVNSSCNNREYGNIHSVMGLFFTGHFDAAQKDYLGWFDSNNITTASSTGNFLLEPLETNTNGLKAIKIPRVANPSNQFEDYYYLEYRQPIGFDTSLPSNTDAFEGALMHRLLSDAHSLLIDTTQPPPESRTAALISAFTNPATGTCITVTSRTSNILSLRVVNPSGCIGT